MAKSRALDNKTEDENITKLRNLTEALTHSGSNSLDDDLFKQVKKICKSSQSYLQPVYNAILSQLKKKNSQIRFLAFEMCKELFSRSTVFREIVIKDLELVFKLTAGINSKAGLPPPKSYAENLKLGSMRTLQSWVDDFGDEYKQLKIAYNYLKKCKGINFGNVDSRTEAEQLRENDNRARLDRLFEERTKSVMEEVRTYESEIDDTIVSLSNCFKLLLPTPEEFFVAENKADAGEITNTSDMDVDEEEISHKNLRRFGITVDYSLELEIDPSARIKIVKTEENMSIIQNAQDCVQLINNRFLPLIKKWSHFLCKHSNKNGSDLKKILDLKEKLHKILDKYKALNIEDESVIKTDSDDDECDDDFEEVTKEGYEDSIPVSEEDLTSVLVQKETTASRTNKRDRNGIQISSTHRTGAETPSSSATDKEGEGEPTSRKEKLLKIAPKLPYDIDLYHWEDEGLTVPTLVSTKIDVDKFWGCAGSDDIHEIPNPEGAAALRTRVIEFAGKFEPVKWACRAPLPSGKLCPRKDRFKCPFHGKILPRDENGNLRNPNEDHRSQKQPPGSSSKQVPDWQDPELLADIKESTGIDLKMPEGRGRKNELFNDNLTHRQMKTSAAAMKIAKSKNHPGLIDVVKRQNNAYTRLSKKLFNRSTMRRVSNALDKMDKRKFNDKFGDCFNY